MSGSISLEKSLQAYKVMHTPTDLSWKQYLAKEKFDNDELLKCSKQQQIDFCKRLEDSKLTLMNNIKDTTNGRIINLKELVGVIIDPRNKDIKKIDRKVIYTSDNGERPIGKKAFDMWGGFQVIDMDIKDENYAKMFKRKIFERLKRYNWFFGIALSSSGKGLHIYTKIQVPESNENDHLKNKILYLTNFRHKYSFVYLACLKIIENDTELNSDDIKRWMDMAMFKPQQGAFVGYDPAPLISTHFFEDFIYVNFDNVEDMGHPDVDWVAHPDLKEMFKRWEWFEDDGDYNEAKVDVMSAPELEVDTKNRFHYKHAERWRLANTLVKLYGKDQGYIYLRKICSNDIRNKELQSDCSTAARHDKEIDIWAVNRLNKFHGFKIKVKQNDEELDLEEITEDIDTVEDPTALMLSKNTKTFYINKSQYLSDIREELISNFGRVTLIEAGAGTGKTEMVKLMVKQGKRVVMVMPFTSTIKSKVEGDSEWVFCYGNRKVKLGDKPGLALTVDKFSRLNLLELKDAGYDYIFIDESHLLFQSEYRPVMPKVIEMIKNTEVPIVMMSGTPIGEDIFFQGLVHLKVVKEDIRVKKFDVRLCDSPKDSLLMMCKHMAADIADHKRVLFPTNKGSLYKEQITAAVNYFLETDHFIFEPATVNYYKKSNIGEDFMNDVNVRKTINNTDILMCSTYLSVGVDILDKFDFNIYFNEIWTPQEIEQFANRLRSHDLYIRLYLNYKDSDGNSLGIAKYRPCSFKFSDDEIKNAHSIIRLCNAMIERNPVEYKYNSMISAILSNNKFIEYNDMENKYYLNEIAFKTIYFERKFRDYAQQLPVLIKGMKSYGYDYASKNMGVFRFNEGQSIKDIENAIMVASKVHKTSNKKHTEELLDKITEDRLSIYQDVMRGRYDISKGAFWGEDKDTHKMVVKNIEVFEKVVPLFTSMEKMYDVDEIKSIFEFCRNKSGEYNFAAIKRIKLLVNMVYNSKKNRLDLPIEEFMKSVDSFLKKHENKKTKKCQTKVIDIDIFIREFVELYARKESKGEIDILLSPITVEEMEKSMKKIFRCLVDYSRPDGKGLVTLKRAELLWKSKEDKEEWRNKIIDNSLEQLTEFLEAIKIKETVVNAPQEAEIEEEEEELEDLRKMEAGLAS